MTVQRVLIIGGAGMLGRPVVRRLIEDGFSVRAMVRDIARAKVLLPAACEFAQGDVRDDARLLDALDACDAAYINLAEPMLRRRPAWDVEVEGSRAVIAACRSSGVRRIIRVSAMGVDDASAEKNPWWAAVSKRDADRAVLDSDLDWTIFRPTWFMESLCTLRVAGRFMLCPDLPRSPLRWIAGDDYARQVAAALRSVAAIHKVYQPQGPELLTIAQASRRLRNAWTRRLRIVPMPTFLMRLATPFSPAAHYLVSLLDMTRDHFSRIDRESIATDLPAATMTIEDYARYIERTGDWPTK
jgi:uncharacterized protein YbjT (DUF2867 family)